MNPNISGHPLPVPPRLAHISGRHNPQHGSTPRFVPASQINVNGMSAQYVGLIGRRIESPVIEIHENHYPDHVMYVPGGTTGIPVIHLTDKSGARRQHVMSSQSSPRARNFYNQQIPLNTVVVFDNGHHINCHNDLQVCVHERHRVASSPPYQLQSLPTTKRTQVDSVPGPNAPKQAHPKIPRAQMNLFIEGLLSMLCKHQRPDEHSQQLLYNYMHEHLQKLNVLLPQNSNEGMLEIRERFCQKFNYIMSCFDISRQLASGLCTASTSDTLIQQLGFKNSFMSIIEKWAPNFFLCQPRYCCDFEQCERLGEGGFGRVYKVKSKMDKQLYAVKKIRLSSKDVKQVTDVQREVHVFSRLKHPNIVVYVTSWLEQGFECGSSDTSPGTTGSYYSTDSSVDNNTEHTVGETVLCDGIVRMGTEPLIEEIPDNGPDQQNSQLENANVIKPQDSSCENSARCYRRSVSLEETSASKRRSISNTLDIPVRAVVSRGCYQQKRKETFVTLYIQMELCSRTLCKWLLERNMQMNRRNVINEADSDAIIRQILTGVDYIHAEEHLMHRDLTSSNIFVNENLSVKIGDFGLTRPNGMGSTEELSQGDTASCKYSTGVGTRIYCAPEQLNGSHYDQKADMYSVGLIEFELFYPFATNMERIVVFEKLRRKCDDSDEMEELWETFPDQAWVIDKLLNHDPRDRPTAAELLLLTAKPTDKDATLDRNHKKWRNDVFKQLYQKLYLKDRTIERYEKQVKFLKKELSDCQKKFMSLTLRVKKLEMISGNVS